MHRTKVIGHLMVATGKTIPEWAASKGYTKAGVYRALNNPPKRKSKIKDDLCKATGLTESEIWPETKGEGLNENAF